MGFWNQDHPLSKDLSRLWDQYVPAAGATAYVETELLRAANRLIYDWYNNGWMNNKTAELEFLQSHELFSAITIEDLTGGRGDQHEEYMDSELATIIELVLEAEGLGNLTALDGDPLNELGMDTREWDQLSYEDDDDEYEDEDYYDEDTDEGDY